MAETEIHLTDWVLLSAVCVSALFGVWRGFVREAMSLAVWVAAIALAWIYGSLPAAWLSGLVESPSLRLLLGSVAVFIACLLLGGMATRAGSSFIRLSGLGDMDRLFGLLFGAARGLLLLVVAAALISFTPLRDAVWWQSSWAAPRLSTAADWGLEQMGLIGEAAAETAAEPASEE